MKTIVTLLSIFVMGTGAFAQGTVTFNNNPATLISYEPTFGGTPVAIPAGNPGAYYFGLLTSLSGAPGTFTFSGIYGTNNATAGLFTGGTARLATIAPGTTFSFYIAGWSASLGPTWVYSWLNYNYPFAPGSFGLSGIGTATAGGGTPPASPGIIFGATGLTSGFTLTGRQTPEPSSMALAGLGAAALLIFRRQE